MQDKIISAIAAYLDKVTTKDSNGFLTEFTWGHTSKIHATEIAAAIAPLVEAGEVDWKDAPEWANWRARDLYGAINYFEEEPIQGEEEWYGGKHEQCGVIPYWTNTLERRPQ